MNTFELDPLQVRHAFGRAARGYERHDALQREVQARLLERLDYYEGTPELVVDIGSGTGRGTAALRKRWRVAAMSRCPPDWNRRCSASSAPIIPQLPHSYRCAKAS